MSGTSMKPPSPGSALASSVPDPLRERIERLLRGTQPVDAVRHASRPDFPGDLPASKRPRRKPLTPAAVLVPLVQRDAGLTVLLTVRTEHLKDHAGQVSFPGGRLEPHDDGPAAAALRETQEEIGLEPRFVDLVGYLDPYLTITGFAVTPVVGLVAPGFALELDAFEVAEAFEVPLAFVLDPRHHEHRTRALHGVEVGYYEIRYGAHRIWGATAGMLVSFYRKLTT